MRDRGALTAESMGEPALRPSTLDHPADAVPRPGPRRVAAPLTPHLLRVKRAFDVSGALVLSVVALPLFLVLCLLIRLDSPGPPIYWRVRLGHNGAPFRCLKFRSMYHDADSRLTEILDANSRFRREYRRYRKLRADPRITRIGRILRRLSLDELPQLWNVLVGDISLIGPRPYDVAELPLMKGRDRVIHAVRPGLTGLWQVSGRNTTTFAQRLALDVEYVQRWSLGLDLKILARTPFTVISGRGAY